MIPRARPLSTSLLLAAALLLSAVLDRPPAAAAAAAPAAAAPAAAAVEPLRHVRIEVTDAPALATELERDGFDVVEGSASARTLELVVTTGELAGLRARGLAPAVLAAGRPWRAIEAELQAAAAQAGEPVPPGYPDLSEVVASLAATAAAHPAIARLVDLTARYGTPPTFEGRHLHALKISDQVDLEEDEPAFLLVSAHHSREIVTPVIALHAIDRLVNSYGADPGITSLVDSYEIWVAPVWNPDGYEHVFNTDNLWRKNRRVFAQGIGVDLNRNYPQGWSNPCSGSTFPGSETYKGPSPASEAETQAMLAFAQDQRFAKVLDYHSSGREVIHGYACWSYPFDPYLAGEATLLSSASGYGGARRAPSADGEHYQWEFAIIAGHAFLIETHTQFQPPYESALAEAALVWPGVPWLLERPIPLWGYVTDAVTGAPLVATIELEGVVFPNGETNESGAAEGRYHAFLPPGTYTVRFEADGYDPLAVAGVEVMAGASTRLDAALMPTTAAVASGATAAGSRLEVRWQNPWLEVRLPESSPVRLRIFDLRGAAVRNLAEGQREAGLHRIHWAGRREDGRALARGIYFYRLEAGREVVSGPLLVLEPHD